MKICSATVLLLSTGIVAAAQWYPPSPPPPVIDTAAPGYFAGLVAKSDYVVVPNYDSKTHALREPVIVKDRTQLDALEKILGDAMYQPTPHVFAVQAGGPITFHLKDRTPVLKLEAFPTIIRLNESDFKVGIKTSAAISGWLRQVLAAGKDSPVITPINRRSSPENVTAIMSGLPVSAILTLYEKWSGHPVVVPSDLKMPETLISVEILDRPKNEAARMLEDQLAKQADIEIVHGENGARYARNAPKK